MAGNDLDPEEFIKQQAAKHGGNPFAGMGAILGEGISTPDAPGKIKPLTPEAQAKGITDAYLEAYGTYLTVQDPTERKQWRDLSMLYRAELVSLVGEQQARVLLGEQSLAPEEPNKEQEQEAAYTPPSQPTREQLIAYFDPKGPHAIDKGRVNPASLSADELQVIYELLNDADQTIGQDDPEGLLDGFVAGRSGLSDIDIAAQRAVHERERQQAREEEALRRETERAKQKAERDAERAQQKAEAEAERQQRQQQQAQLRIEQERARQQQRQQTLTRTVAIRGAQALGHVNVRLGGMPTPGGIPLLLFTILFILFALVPQNKSGATRIQLLWLALVGKVTLPDAAPPVNDSNPVGSAVGAIGAGIRAGITGGGGLSDTTGNSSGTGGGVSNATTDSAITELSFSIPYASS